MAAPSLPAGITGPARADFRTAAQTAQFVSVYGPPAEAWVWQTSGRRFLLDLNSAVGRRREAIWPRDAFTTLRARLTAAGVSVADVSSSAWDRETLRAAIWYAYRNNLAASGTSPGNIWLPISLEYPPLGVVIAGSDEAPPPPMQLRPRGASTTTSTTTTSGPTAAQRQAARDLDAYVRRTASLRSNVRDATVEGYQRAMGGGLTLDGKYGEETRRRMVALGVSSPAPVPSQAAGNGGASTTTTTSNTNTTTQNPVRAGLAQGASMGVASLAALLVIGGVVGTAVYLNEPPKRPTPMLPAKGGPRVPPRPRAPSGPAPKAGRRPFTEADDVFRARAKAGR